MGLFGIRVEGYVWPHGYFANQKNKVGLVVLQEWWVCQSKRRRKEVLTCQQYRLKRDTCQCPVCNFNMRGSRANSF